MLGITQRNYSGLLACEIIVAAMAPKRQQAPGPPMTLDMTDAEEYRELATQEAALAKLAVTNEKRAQHYAMAAYYTRLADAKEKLATTLEIMTDTTPFAT